MPEQARVTIVASRFRDGGVERLMNRLAAGFLEQGVACHFVLGEDGAGAAAATIPNGVDVRVADTSGILDKLSDLVAELGWRRHAVLIVRTTDCSPVLRHLRMMGRRRPAAFILAGDYLTPRLQRSGFGRLKAWKYRHRLRRHWRLADGIISTDPNITADWASTGMFAAANIHTVAPPVVGPDLDRDSHDTVPHSWFGESAPVILGVGRLTSNKRFELLLAALAHLSDCRDVRLIILGRGPEEKRLRSLSEQWGIAGRVDFPGYMRNPYAWMRRADVLALPSRVEPFGLVLIESLYVGTPFVAAGTPPGPRSIHQATRHGYLLGQDTAAELASGIRRVLDGQYDESAMRQAAEAYDYRVSSREYLRVMLSSAYTS